MNFCITLGDMKYDQITSCLLSKISKLSKIQIDHLQNKKILEKCLVDISKVKSAEVNTYLNRSLDLIDFLSFDVAGFLYSFGGTKNF